MNLGNKKKGFTLIELSIVLVILGLIVATITPLFVTLSKKNKLSEGKRVVATARDEIKGEILRTRTVPSDLGNIGHSVDPWRNGLVYIPAPGLVGRDICSWLGGGIGQTGLSVCLDGDCTSSRKGNVAFIIASIGPNFNRQLEAAANREGDKSGRAVRLYGYGVTVDQYTVSPDPNRGTDQFDDIVEFVTLAEMIGKMSCSVGVVNDSGQTVCSGGAAVVNGNSLGVLNINQLLAVGSTVDNCLKIDTTCTITHSAAQGSDTDMDQEVHIISGPPTCTIQDL